MPDRSDPLRLGPRISDDGADEVGETVGAVTNAMAEGLEAAIVANDPLTDRSTTWEQRLTDLGRAHRRPRRTRFGIELAQLAGAFVVVAAAAVVAIRSVTDFWLPLDAAHFIAEADWLRGNRSILPSIHPPVFPSIVLLFEFVAPAQVAVEAAMAVTFAAFVIGTYLVVRTWFQTRPAVVATGIGAGSPVLAEAIGWGGGAHLGGLAAMTFAIAATDRWVLGRLSPIWVGVAAGVTVATHPFATVALAVFALARLSPIWVRRANWKLRGRGPASVGGLFIAATGAAPFVAASGYYYTSVSSPGSTSIGFPDLATTFELLDWATREHVLVFMVTLAALATPLVVRPGQWRPTMAALSATIVLLSSMVRGDGSYQTRVIYLVPVSIALSAGLVATTGSTRWPSTNRPDRFWLAAGSSVLAITLVVQVGFVTRLHDSINFYAQVDQSDMEALARSSVSADGIVISSYVGDSVYAPTNWYVNAATLRRAVSPIAPWLSTNPVEGQAGLEAQRFFVGDVVAENEALQIAASGTESGHFELQILARVDGWYFPVVELDPVRSRFPFTVTAASASVTGDMLTLSMYGTEDTDVLDITVALDGTTVTVIASVGVPGSLHLVFAPGPLSDWIPTPTSTSPVSIEHRVHTELLRSTVSATGNDRVRVSVYGPGNPIGLDTTAPTVTTLSFVFENLPDVPRSEVTTSTSDAIRERIGIDRVVIWRNTGLIERFTSACFLPIDHGTNLAVFDYICAGGVGASASAPPDEQR